MDSRESVIDFPVTSQQEEHDSIDDTASEDLEWENMSPRRVRGGKRGGGGGGEEVGGGRGKDEGREVQEVKEEEGKQREGVRQARKVEGQVIPCWILTQREVSLHKSIVFDQA